jgi:hypothetical protein
MANKPQEKGCLPMVSEDGGGRYGGLPLRHIGCSPSIAIVRQRPYNPHYSKLAGADEERTLARLRALRSDLFDPTIALHHGRLLKRTGDGVLIEFKSVVDAVRCAIAVQSGMVERNAGCRLIGGSNCASTRYRDKSKRPAISLLAQRSARECWANH